VLGGLASGLAVPVAPRALQGAFGALLAPAAPRQQPGDDFPCRGESHPVAHV